MRSLIPRLCAATLVAIVLVQPVNAQLVSSFDRPSFHLATGGSSLGLENFDGIAAGTLLTNRNGIAFAASNGIPIVTSSFLTSTNPNGLGSTSVGFFLGSELATFSFDSPINAFAIDVNTFATADGSYTATLDSGLVVTSRFEVFQGQATGQFVGFQSDTPFSTVSIDSRGGFSYTLDTMFYGSKDEGELTGPFYVDQPHIVTQGPGGSTSHTAGSLIGYDIDFAATGHVPVIAAHSGTVYVFEDESNSGGFRPNGFGNWVTVHDEENNFFSVYAHLNDAVAGLNGKKVRAGQPLGIEGNTGFSLGQHLHFGIYQGDPTLTNPFDSTAPGAWVPIGIEDDRFGMLLSSSSSGPFSQFNIDYNQQGTVISSDFSVGSRLFSNIARPTVSNFNGNILQDQTTSFTYFVPGNEDMLLSLYWPGSELELAIVDPEGNVHGVISETDGLIETLIAYPRPGIWTFDVTGIVTASDGEPFRFDIQSFDSPEPTIVFIDIKPDSTRNRFNQNGKGVIPVAILGDNQLDVYTINMETLSFNGLKVKEKGNSRQSCSFDDVDHDGIDDLLCHFQDVEKNWIPTNDTATLTGHLSDGTRIEGSDAISFVP